MKKTRGIIVKHREPVNYPLIISLIALAAYAGFRVGGILEDDAGLGLIASPAFLISSKHIVFSGLTVGLAAFCGFASAGALFVYEDHKQMTLKNDIYGSAEWGRPEDAKGRRYGDGTKPEHNILMTNTEWFERKNGANRNTILLGRPGTGKSRYFFKPNILNAEGTIVITDPKGEILRDCGHSLLVKGYTIKALNIEEKFKSNHYNPLAYIKRKDPPPGSPKGTKGEIMEDDVMSLIDCIFKNTKGDMDSTSGDPFWEKAEMIFLQALFYYVLLSGKYTYEQQNFAAILDLIEKATPDENTGQSELNALFDEWEQRDPTNIGIHQWKLFQNSAGSPKTMATIVLTASARLGPLNIKEVADLVSDDDMELDRMGKAGDEGKIAYFIITNPGDSAFNFIASIFYTQVFKIIDYNAKQNSGSCATPVDLYMDEWAQLGTIPRFVEQLAYVRGLNVGIVVGLQSLDQLKKKEKDAWQTALDCCDYTLFLGSMSKETLEYMSAMLGKQTFDKHSRNLGKQGGGTTDTVGRDLATVDELRQMPKGKCILLASGLPPFYSDVYDLEKHPDYGDLYEPWKKGNPDNDAKYYDHYTMGLKKHDALKKLTQATGGLVTFHEEKAIKSVPYEYSVM